MAILKQLLKLIISDGKIYVKYKCLLSILSVIWIKFYSNEKMNVGWSS